ncbi:MAG TPA: hypothetical protein VH796_00680 [Nitrososphaeraceae archaeon]|jgi:aspartate oxidase
MIKDNVRLLGIGLSLLLVTLAFATPFSNPTLTTYAQDNTSFANSIASLVKKAHDVSLSYTNETGKSGKGQVDNKTKIAITDSFKPKFQSLINEAKALQPPKQLQNATDLYIKSLESQLQSNNHYRSYLATNNATENKLSTKLLSDSSNYEFEAFKKFKDSGLFTIAPG